MIATAAFVLAASSSGCGASANALRSAQTAWRSFLNGDFIDGAPAAEAQRLAAKSSLATAGRAAAACKPDRGELDRTELLFEIDLVDARRARGDAPSLAAVNADLAKLRALGLDRTEPAHYEAFAQRDAEMQAETRGGLVAPPPAARGFSGGTVRSSCVQPDAPPVPLGALAPVSADAASLHRPHGTTIVAVNVSSTGTVQAATVVLSSGDPVLDQAVTGAASRLSYAPARRGCMPAPGEYRATYTFPQL